jgi:hypothetical protein
LLRPAHSRQRLRDLVRDRARSVQLENEFYRVRVQSYAEGPRRVVVWRKVDCGPYVVWGSLAIPDDVDGGKLEAEVMSRLPLPDRAVEYAKARVAARLRSGLGQAV